MNEGNPFASIGAPPGASDPKGQLEWLIRCVNAFASESDPNVRALRDKLYLTLAELQPEMTADATALFNARLVALQIETYELIAVVTNQIRATLRVQLKRGMAKPKRLNTELLQRELAQFARAMRMLTSALKVGDDAKRLEANAMLDAVGRYGEKLRAEADKDG